MFVPKHDTWKSKGAGSVLMTVTNSQITIKAQHHNAASQLSIIRGD